MSSPIVPTGDFAVYQGRVLEVVFAGDTGPALRDDGGAFPAQARRGANSRGSWVEVPDAELERKYRRLVTATWDGARIIVMSVSGEDVAFLHTEDPQWAAAHGLAGSQYEGGWTGRAPVAELEDVTVEEREKPLGPTRTER